MPKAIYRSLKDLDVAHYFAFPPKSDVMHCIAPDGSVMDIIACPVPHDLWRYDRGMNVMVHSRTGRTAEWVAPERSSPAHFETPFTVMAAKEGRTRTTDLTPVGVEPMVWRELTKPNAVPRPPRRFRASDAKFDVAVHPSEYFTDTDVAEIVQRAGQVLVDLCAIGKFLPYDQQLVPKLAVRLRELAEREVESTLQYGLKLSAELKALSRASLDTEIDRSSIEDKQRSLHYLRSQHFVLLKIQKGIMDAYQHVLDEYEMEHGRKWYAYKTISERATKWRRISADERRAEVKRLAMADQLSPVEFARYMANLRKYDPSAFSGVDGQEPGLTKRMVVGRKMVGDFYEPDSVRRVRGNEESLAGEYGDGLGDWGRED